MKISLIILALIANLVSIKAQSDSLGRIAAQIINDERRRLSIDTLEYEIDTFCVATDWADSNHVYFNIKGNTFSRDAAHRDCGNRVQKYEVLRNREWKCFAECVAMGKIQGKISPVEYFAKALLGSRDHYKVLMKERYKKIIIGIIIKDGFFSMAVFTTTDFK